MLTSERSYKRRPSFAFPSATVFCGHAHATSHHACEVLSLFPPFAKVCRLPSLLCVPVLAFRCSGGIADLAMFAAFVALVACVRVLAASGSLGMGGS